MKTFNLSAKLGVVCAAAIIIYIAASCKKDTGPFPTPVKTEPDMSIAGPDL
jgi:hypothetical protein